MRMSLLCIPVLLAGMASRAEDPFAPPPELEAFARRVTSLRLGTRPKLQAILEGIHRPESEGGLGVAYDNAYTRTVEEVWRERKANCLSMTAFFVAAARTVGIPADYAVAHNTNRWRRVGSVIRFEHHVVAMVRLGGGEELVADFLPELRRRMGVYRVSILAPERFRAFFYTNRAVEHLEAGRLQEATECAQTALEMDPMLSLGWNIKGVVQKAKGDLEGAESAYRTALKLDARDSAAIGNMETLMRELGRPEEATKFREAGNEVRKKDPYFQAFLAEEAMGSGELEEARKRLAAAIKIQPYEPEFHLAQARLQLLQGHTREALKAIQQAQRWALPAERARYDSKLAIIQGLQEGPKK